MMTSPPPPRPLSRCNALELSTVTKRGKKHGLVAYGMDRLPDEILIVILSCLNLKEAVRTSIISRRWRYLWRFTSCSLEFLNQWDGNPGTWVEPTVFLSWVDQVVKLHQGPSVDKFIVHCQGITDESPNRICDWIHFAMEKEVKVFELDISCHDFPDLNKFLSISREVKPSVDRIGLTSLTSLRLVDVNVKDEMIEYLLSSCRHLEHLCIKFDNYMKKLNVLSSSLKSLSIFYCTKLKSLTISAANLLSFVYGEASMSPVLKLQLQNVPLLSELQLKGPHCGSFLFEPSEHSKYSHQLQRLVLNVPMLDVVSAPRHDHSLFGLPQLQCLKQLDLILHARAGESFLFFVLLTTACPFLSSLGVVMFYDSLASKEAIATGLRRYNRAKADLTAHGHPCLKVIKLINFAGYRSDFRFALALLQIAKSLEKIIIKPGPGFLGAERIATVRERAKQLEANLPQGAELLIVSDLQIGSDLRTYHKELNC
ncbi:putative F-box/LRR-repeat protein At3g28410 isoform X1 [Coffea eugenioides]|uniref:putative F-box/LRR-repeat protein At3g28410 isoform X1 n=1 Tax=Coffea eugenioides TaxID=49369 RepID=UPI000F60BC7E|nr:putative F-box/LRR-repeat protein At3g28410 isoform X1 [Coffea eugenioides]